MLKYMDDKFRTPRVDVHRQLNSLHPTPSAERSRLEQSKQDYVHLFSAFRSDRQFCNLHAALLERVAESSLLAELATADTSTPPSDALLHSAALIFDGLQRWNRPTYHDPENKIADRRFRRSELFVAISEVAARMAAFYAMPNGTSFRNDVAATGAIDDWPAVGQHSTLDPEDASPQSEGGGVSLQDEHDFDQEFKLLRRDPVFCKLLEITLTHLTTARSSGERVYSSAGRGLVSSGLSEVAMEKIIDALERGFDPERDYTIVSGHEFRWEVPNKGVRIALLIGVISNVAARMSAYYASSSGRSLRSEVASRAHH